MSKELIVPLVSVLFLANCTGSFRSTHLKGSWRTIEAAPYDNDNLYDSIIFSPSGEMSIYFIDNNRTVDSLKAQYIVERKKKLFKTISKGQTFTFQILKLTNNFMKMKNTEMLAITKFKRIQ